MRVPHTQETDSKISSTSKKGVFMVRTFPSFQFMYLTTRHQLVFKDQETVSQSGSKDSVPYHAALSFIQEIVCFKIYDASTYTD